VSVQVALLNNLRAGRSGAEVSRILGFLRAFPHVHHVETERAQALPEAISDLAKRQVDLLVVNGGDGTLQHTLTEILAHGVLDPVPMIAPLRGGRTNMTALDIGSNRDPVKGLAGLLQAVESGRIVERISARPVLRIEPGRARDVHYGMFFGAGLIPRAIELTHRLFPTGRSQGAFGATVVTGSLIARAVMGHRHSLLTPDKAEILVDGEAVRGGEFQLLIASSLDHLFARMNPFWGSGSGGVRFTGIAAGAKRKLLAAPGILRGRPRAFATPENGYTSRNAESVELTLGSGFTIDGETYAPHPDEHIRITADRRVTFVRA
jgi:diacylglycerol kinase family enzyme